MLSRFLVAITVVALLLLRVVAEEVARVGANQVEKRLKQQRAQDGLYKGRHL